MSFLKRKLDLTVLGVSRCGRIECVDCVAQHPTLIMDERKHKVTDVLYGTDVQNSMLCDCCGTELHQVVGLPLAD